MRLLDNRSMWSVVPKYVYQNINGIMTRPIWSVIVITIYTSLTGTHLQIIIIGAT